MICASAGSGAGAVAATAVAWAVRGGGSAGAARGCAGATSSEVQCSTTGPGSENSKPARSFCSARQRVRAVRQPSMMWKPKPLPCETRQSSKVPRPWAET